MCRRKIFLFGTILSLSLLLAGQRMSIAGVFGGFHIPLLTTPETITISDKGLDMPGLSIYRYTEVTWINGSKSDVKMKFGKGKTCKEVSSAVFPALGVRMDPQRCFVISNSITPKGTLRFRFEEPGDYRYEVEYVGKNTKEDGVILVR